MEGWVWGIIILSAVTCFAGSAFLIAYEIKMSRKEAEKTGVSNLRTGGLTGKTAQGRKWNRILISYYLLCLIFIAIILYQSVQGMEERAYDSLAVLLGAFFFTIPALAMRKKAIRRERASVLTTATCVKLEMISTIGSNKRKFYSILEFSAKEKTYKVRYDGRLDREGEKVELYYAPEDPGIVYVPQMEKAETKIFFVLCTAFTAVFVILGLIAPIFR